VDGFHPLTVAAVDRLTDDAIAITFEVPTELREVFTFTPGQHLTLRHVLDGEDLRRTYSVCASTTGPLRVAVKRLDGGAFSTWVCKELQAGDVVEVLPPAGRFGPHVSADRRRRYGLVGAGSGITPLLAVAATVLEVEPDSEVVLVYGNRTSRDVMFLEELSDLKDRYPSRLQLLWVMSREEQESELLTGRLDRDRLGRVLDAFVPVDGVDEWYLCGPFGMVTEARDLLLERGATEVHVELFHAAAPPPRAPRVEDSLGATLVAVLHGRSTTVEMERGTSVLDALLRVRSDAPYACKGGVCGTCRARLVGGRVEMDANWALEPDELAAGVVLTCQSHPLTDEVRLEFL
jgi:ring-1,2-phenylacetyl-CoA epoxidase subunit PaaE